MPTDDRPMWCKRCRKPIDNYQDERLCKLCGRQGCYHCTPDGECDSCMEKRLLDKKK